MKINLGANTDVREGYINIDLFPESNKVLKGDFRNLDQYAQDNSVEEIVAKNVLEYISPFDIRNVMINWANKLTSGGKLFIMSIDLYMIANQLNFGQIDMEKANNILYQPGSQVKPIGIYSLSIIEALGINLGFRVSSKFCTPDNMFGLELIKQ